MLGSEGVCPILVLLTQLFLLFSAFGMLRQGRLLATSTSSSPGSYHQGRPFPRLESVLDCDRRVAGGAGVSAPSGIDGGMDLEEHIPPPGILPIWGTLSVFPGEGEG